MGWKMKTLRVIILTGLISIFLIGLMVVDELMIHFSFHATTYEYPLLGVFPIWDAWKIAFAFILGAYLMTFLIAATELASDHGESP